MMNDLAICKRIAEIEGVEHLCDRGVIVLSENYNELINTICSGRYSPEQVIKFIDKAAYNPLTDDALFLHLLESYGDKLYTEHDIEGGGNKTKWSIDPEHFEDNKFIYNRRSVLLAIIEAHNE